MAKKIIDRREFLKRMGAGAAVVGSSALLPGCAGKVADTVAENIDPRGTGKKTIGEMTYRTNPNTGDKVSILGYGCMRWPSLPGGAKADDGNDLDQEQINRLVDFALEHGVNYFDTSPAYSKGFSEASTGTALARHPRNSYYIATKLSNFAPQTWSREASQQMLRNSLRYLKTDYIDYLLLHSIGGNSRDLEGNSLTPMQTFERRYIDNGILDWLVEQKQKGVIRNLGFSYHGDVNIFNYALQMMDEGKIHWDFVQIQMNYVDWNHAKDQNARNTNASYLYEELDKRGIPVVIMEPLLGGRLSKLPNHVISYLKQRRPDDSVASWAFRFCGTYPRVLCVLSGMTYMEHLQDNLSTFAPLEPLSPEEETYLDETAQLILKYPTIPCNDCKYCMPCPYNLNIPAILLHYNKLVNEGSVPKGQEDPNYKELRRKYLISYDRAVPEARQASRCIGCGICEHHCPQNIKIPREMQRIDAFVESLKRNPVD